MLVDDFLPRFFGMFTPDTLGEDACTHFDAVFFQRGLVQPPSSNCQCLLKIGRNWLRKAKIKTFFEGGAVRFSEGLFGPDMMASWNPKQIFINGCFIGMIPNLYIENGCFTKHPFINGCLGFQVFNTC